MAKNIRMSFSRGGEFQVELLVDAARDNTRYLVNALPLEADVLHCTWSGQGLYTKLPDFPVNPGENQQMIGIRPGTVAIEYFPPHMRSLGPRTGIIVTFGHNFLFRNPFTVSNPLLLVGRVREGLDELADIGPRIRRYGKERIRFEETVA